MLLFKIYANAKPFLNRPLDLLLEKARPHDDRGTKNFHLWLQGLVHITGGGFTENIPRIMPKGLGCRIDRSSWEVPQLFQWIQEV